MLSPTPLAIQVPAIRAVPGPRHRAQRHHIAQLHAAGRPTAAPAQGAAPVRRVALQRLHMLPVQGAVHWRAASRVAIAARGDAGEGAAGTVVRAAAAELVVGRRRCVVHVAGWCSTEDATQWCVHVCCRTEAQVRVQVVDNLVVVHDLRTRKTAAVDIRFRHGNGAAARACCVTDRTVVPDGRVRLLLVRGPWWSPSTSRGAKCYARVAGRYAARTHTDVQVGHIRLRQRVPAARLDPEPAHRRAPAPSLHAAGARAVVQQPGHPRGHHAAAAAGGQAWRDAA